MLHLSRWSIKSSFSTFTITNSEITLGILWMFLLKVFIYETMEIAYKPLRGVIVFPWTECHDNVLRPFTQTQEWMSLFSQAWQNWTARVWMSIEIPIFLSIYDEIMNVNELAGPRSLFADDPPFFIKPLHSNSISNRLCQSHTCDTTMKLDTHLFINCFLLTYYSQHTYFFTFWGLVKFNFSHPN